MKKPGDVVVLGDEESGRIGERHIGREQRRGDMPVRGDDRKRRDHLVQFAGGGTRRVVDRKQSIRIENCGG
ncbi:hypothetical protein J2X03_003614 [Microbacterium trichothecenolyticum]|nr:hypothetical protein [Microbacterium trichothecenolyticum]